MTNVMIGPASAGRMRGRVFAEELEGQMVPLYLAALDRAKLGGDTRLLDVGCGTGSFLRIAVATGVGRAAEVQGIDADPDLIDIARERVPAAVLRVGDPDDLPREDQTFDAVTCLGVFQHAPDSSAAVREGRRVVRQGGKVVVAAWGRPQQCEAAQYLNAIGALDAFALSAPNALEQIVMDAGLIPVDVVEVDVPWRFKDLDRALRGLLSTGLAERAIRETSEPDVRAAVTDAIAPFRTSRGEYRLENRFRFIIARRVVAIYTTYQSRS